jgi:hypothetical protein
LAAHRSYPLFFFQDIVSISWILKEFVFQNPKPQPTQAKVLNSSSSSSRDCHQILPNPQRPRKEFLVSEVRGLLLYPQKATTEHKRPAKAFIKQPRVFGYFAIQNLKPFLQRQTQHQNPLLLLLLSSAAAAAAASSSSPSAASVPSPSSSSSSAAASSFSFFPSTKAEKTFTVESF